MWDARYGEEEFAYGEKPNKYIKEQLEGLRPKSILFPAEGEGRNAVYAATLGWEVSAFDLSHEGYRKAISLCIKHQVSIDYKIGEYSKLEYDNESFDALALVYAHFPPHLRADYHQQLGKLVKPGGIIILEGFSKNNLELSQKQTASNGPKNSDMLYTTEQISLDFKDFKVVELKEEIIDIDEGPFHQGKASVIRFVGKKR